jgi:type II secretory pathway component PulM
LKTPVSLGVRLRAFYTAQTPRERMLIAFAIGVILFSLGFLAVEWTWQEHRRLAQALPQAQAQLERMQQEAAEFMRLKNQPSAQGVNTIALQEALHLASQARGLKLRFVTTPQGLQVEGQALAAPFLEFLGQIHAQWGLFPVELDVRATPSGLQIKGLLGTERAL